MPSAMSHTTQPSVSASVSLQPSQSHPFFPLFINLSGKRVVVVGAGGVAERKIATLLEHGARVDVIAPSATESVRLWAADNIVTWQARPFRAGDLSGAFMAVAATGDPAVNEAVYAEAERRNMLINVVDVPELCNAIVPSTLRRGALQIAVSTGGAAPSVARDVRRELETRFPAYWERYLDVLGDVRKLVQTRVDGPAATRAPLYEAVARSDLMQRVAAGQTPDPEDVYRRVVAPLLARDASAETDAPSATNTFSSSACVSETSPCKDDVSGEVRA